MHEVVAHAAHVDRVRVGRLERLRLRARLVLALHELHALRHARQTESTSSHGRLVEADTEIDNLEFDATRHTPERDVDVSRTTVLGGVLERLLQHAEQT